MSKKGDRKGQYVEIAGTVDNSVIDKASDYMRVVTRQDGSYMEVARPGAVKQHRQKIGDDGEGKGGDWGYFSVASQGAVEAYRRTHGDDDMRGGKRDFGYMSTQGLKTEYQEFPIASQQYSWHDLLMTLDDIVDSIKSPQSDKKPVTDLRASQGSFFEIIARYNEGYNQLPDIGRQITSGKIANQYNAFSRKLDKAGSALAPNTRDEKDLEINRSYSVGAGASKASFSVKKIETRYGDLSSDSSYYTYSFDIEAIKYAAKNARQDIKFSIPRVDNTGKKVSRDHIIITPEGAVTWIPGSENHDKAIGKSQIEPGLQKELMQRLTESKAQKCDLTIER